MLSIAMPGNRRLSVGSRGREKGHRVARRMTRHRDLAPSTLVAAEGTEGWAARVQNWRMKAHYLYDIESSSSTYSDVIGAIMLRPRTRPTHVPTLKSRVEPSLAAMAAIFTLPAIAPTRPANATALGTSSERAVSAAHFAPSTSSS